MDARIARALHGKEVVIDITTIGRRSRQPTRQEIWFHRIGESVIITGSPGPRNWLANLIANPEMIFHLKGAVKADLPAKARIVNDPDERRAIMSAPETSWYRDNHGGVDRLVASSPMVEVIFED
jgi:deazaflavin-dependent oxidoreductase (nitroreductase family)